LRVTCTGIVLALARAILLALGGVLNRKPMPMPPLAVAAWFETQRRLALQRA